MPTGTFYTKEEINTKLEEISTELDDKVDKTEFEIATDDEIKQLLGIS